ncbi:sensor histidine kinase, partial [Bacillus sp. SIMBA_161]
LKNLRVKYFYQLIASHMGVLLFAVAILSTLFIFYGERVAYSDKAEELERYGEQILEELEQARPGTDLQSYVTVLEAQNI